MAGVIAPTPAKPSLAKRSRAFLGDQIAAQTLRWRMWAPVAFGGGCAVYFALKSELPAWPLLAAAMIAAWPWLALRVSGKKVAAIAGLLAVGTYLVVSGAPPPAERAAITASIAFLAILLDRHAITMHALAVAAFLVLLLQPEAIVTPGFQMSFAATAALVALVEAWPRRPKEISAPLPILIAQRAGAWLGAAILASLVAGVATGPFAMQHFNRTAMYGLAANLATRRFRTS